MKSRPPRRVRAALAAGRPVSFDDLRNPKRQSGFDMVGTLGNSPNGHGQKGERYRAHLGIAEDGRQRRGPARRTPEEAAFDYCVYANSGATPALSIPRYPDVTIDMGNTTRHAPKVEPVKVVRPRHTGKHDVYDVVFLTAGNDIVCRKVGITARGHARYADVCKTLGMSIKPFGPAVTFPSEEAAKVAEAKLVSDLAADSENWIRVGKESFYPNSLAALGLIVTAMDSGYSEEVRAA